VLESVYDANVGSSYRHSSAKKVLLNGTSHCTGKVCVTYEQDVEIFEMPPVGICSHGGDCVLGDI
jgi:hypothetical protein